jgi:anti-anti-sigma factor
MEIAEQVDGHVVVLTPSGDMDPTALPTFEGRLSALLEDGVRAVLWDLSRVEILSSLGVGFLLRAGMRLQRVGGSMALANAGRFAKATLRTMGVLDVFSLHDSREAGIRFLEGRLASS